MPTSQNLWLQANKEKRGKTRPLWEQYLNQVEHHQDELDGFS